MNQTEPAEAWQPTTEQILMAPERAILAALEITLLMAERTLRAEHVSLEDDREPNPPHLAIAGSILLLAASLRELLAAYNAAIDRLIGDN